MVSVAPDVARVHHLHISTEKSGDLIGLPEGRQSAYELVGFSTQRRQWNIGIDGYHRSKVDSDQFSGCYLQKLLLKPVYIGAGHDEARRLAMPSKAGEQILALGQGGKDIEFGDAASTTPGYLPVQLEHNSRSIEHIGQLASDHSHHPGRVIGSANHQQRQVSPLEKQSLLRLGKKLGAQPLALAVTRLKRSRKLTSLRSRRCG